MQEVARPESDMSRHKEPCLNCPNKGLGKSALTKDILGQLSGGGSVQRLPQEVQGYLAHKKQRPPRTLR